MDERSPIITLSQVSYVDVLRGASLLDSATVTIPRGSIVGVSSTNQEETTSLLKILKGELAPTSGTITVSTDPEAPDPLPDMSTSWMHDRAFPTQSLLDNLYVNTPLRWGERLWNRNALRLRVERLYDELGFDLTWHRECRQMSRKEHVAASIVRTLLPSASVYLFDYVFDELTDGERLRVAEKIQRLAQAGHTIVYSTAHPQTTAFPNMRLLLLANGHVTFFGSARDIDPRHIEYYLVNSAGNAKLLVARELNRLRQGTREPIAFIQHALDLLSLFVRRAPIFCVYRDMNQHVQGFSRNLASKAAQRQVDDMGKRALLETHPLPSHLTHDTLTFELYPLTTDASMIRHASMPKTMGILGVMMPSSPTVFSQQTFVKEFKNALSSLMAERDLENRIKHRHRLDSLGVLAGGVAHDFNNSLSALIGAAELIQKRIETPPLSGYVDIILKAAHDAQSLTRKLLSFSQKNETTFQEVDFHDIVSDAVSLLKSGSSKKVELRLELQAQNVTVHGDAAELKNIVVNLGLNAIQAVDAQAGEVVFATKNVARGYDANKRTCHSTASSAIELTVTDNGPGIGADVINKIFEPYYSTKLTTGGHGLGLTVVYSAVKAHNGSIYVTNAARGGAQFSLLFPVSASESLPSLERPQPLIADGHAHILLCDDDERIRFVLASMLESLGYSVTVTSSASECMDAFREHWRDIDVVLLDDLMPGMAGRDCFYYLQALDPDVKVMMISGFRQSEYLAKLEQDGLAGFLSKPITLDELASALQTTLVKTRR